MNVKELASTEDARLDEWNNFAATEALSRLDKPEDRVQTGFPALDKALGGGLLATGIHVIGAAPSMGDTTLVMQIAENASASGRKVLAFSLEASELTIVTKAISREMKRQNPRTAETATQIRAADRDMDPNGARWRAIERAKKTLGPRVENLYIFGPECKRGGWTVEDVGEWRSKTDRSRAKKPKSVILPARTGRTSAVARKRANRRMSPVGPKPDVARIPVPR